MTSVYALLAICLATVSCSSDSATSGSKRDTRSRAVAPPSQQISFEIDVLPILSQGCRPCHFEGGKMYEKLPFDRPETIRKLGNSLFTRIKDEEQREVIRAFLADPKKSSRSSS